MSEIAPARASHSQSEQSRDLDRQDISRKISGRNAFIDRILNLHFRASPQRTSAKVFQYLRERRVYQLQETPYMSHHHKCVPERAPREQFSAQVKRRLFEEPQDPGA